MAKPSAPISTPDDAAAVLNKLASGATRTSPRKRANSGTNATESPSKRPRNSLPAQKKVRKSQLQRRSKTLVEPAPRPRDTFEVPAEQEEEEQAPASTETPPRKLRDLRVKASQPSFPKEGVNPLPSPEKESPTKPRKSKNVASKVTSAKYGAAGETSAKQGRGRPKKVSGAESSTNGVRPQVDGLEGREQNAEAAEDNALQQRINHLEQEVEAQVEQTEQVDEEEAPTRQKRKPKSGREMKHKLSDFWGKQRFAEFETQACLFDCREQWAEMLEAARMNRGSVVKPKTKIVFELESRIISMQIYLAKRAGSNRDKVDRAVRTRLDKIKEILPELETTQDDRPNLIRDDLYTVVIPSFVFLIKSLVNFYFSVEDMEFAAVESIVILMRMSLKVCRLAAGWRPRPSNLDNRVLGDTRDLITANLRKLHSAYDGERKTLEQELSRLAYEDERGREWQASQEAARLKREEDMRKLAKHRAWRARELVAREEEYQFAQSEIRRKIEEKREQRLQAERSKSVGARGSPGHALNGYHRRAHASTRMPAWASTADDIFDIDDFEFGTQEAFNDPAGNGSARKSAVARGKLPERPRPRVERERTEDIPAPMPTKPEWTRGEWEALVGGLERFTGKDRFERILNESGFGLVDQRLARRDLDELMEQARFLKRSMARDLETLGREYDWLRSVPG